ncbi:hypothetical protein HF086_013623 [Spodoptera exigua]|uniref:Fibronectin type-III domain-containing protein n=1 Tax=Spodoptera exigua TaxID=7107 RepID=A0A922MDT7_SPOEX|nr:hypothetical protein HF086_013623 [Spodoptera exigua]
MWRHDDLLVVPESPPTRVSCSALSSSSMKVSWNPPPIGQHGGLIQGYKVIYSPLTTDHGLLIMVLRSAVPSAPEKIKALAFSSDSVLVSWLPPVHPNGIISHYTVYYREAGRLGKHSSFTVPADKKTDTELMFQVRNLMENQLYEFWVSATTGSGEGESTLVVGQGPSSRKVNEQSSGNFTCTASNTIGEDTIVYVVVAIMPPAAPTLSLQYTTTSSIKLHWQLPGDTTEPILGPKPPKPEDHVHMNSTAIKINFYAWRDGGCPILGFRVSYRRAGSEHWIKVGDGLSSASHVVAELTPATWYELAVEAFSDAGMERVTLNADTHTLAGGRIPPIKPSSPLSGASRPASMRTVLVSCVASGVVIVVTLAAIICLVHGKKKFFCISSDHYMRDDRKLSESNEAEREKLREGQKLYSSSSINGNEKSNDDSSAELYEISPYATFGVSAAHSLQFRTLARREDDAAPPHRRRHRACDHYRYDESSLSKCSTVEARHRMRAACASAGGGAPSNNWRDTHTDSDDNSDSAANTTTKGSGTSPCNSAYGSGRRSARTTSR